MDEAKLVDCEVHPSNMIPVAQLDKWSERVVGTIQYDTLAAKDRESRLSNSSNDSIAVQYVALT